MTVFGYVRASTHRQDETIELQPRQITGYAMIQGWDVAHIYIEQGVSGSVPVTERPEGRKMLSGAKKGDVIIAAKMDRMFRSASDALNVLEDLKKRGITLHLIDLGGDVTGNGLSKLIFTILAAVAEAERDRIRERITDVKGQQKARGAFLGGSVPFGYVVVDGALVEDAAEQKAIQKIVALKAESKSLRKIEAAIKADGIKVSRGTIDNIIKRA